MKKNLLFLFLINAFYLLSSVAVAQQGNIWYFGDHAGVDFNSGIPVALTDGALHNINTYSEGTAVISDGSGDLLFYTNGQQLWNKNHQVMMNGDSLFGSFSTTQSSIIIPQPGSNRFFYVFTLDDYWEHGFKNGFRYSVVDICLDNGLGGVIQDKKNILLLDTITERLAAVRHSNGIDYWIVTHRLSSDEFYSHLLTSIGITNIVVTPIGSVNSAYQFQGQLKISPDGSKLAVGSSILPYQLLELFDFDNSTGVISNYKSIALPPTDAAIYGIEFSPDNSKLYAYYMSYYPPEGMGIVQYDLNAGGGNTDSINSSMNTLFQTSPITARGLQLGPDGKIYAVGFPDNDYLIAINSPDNYGPSSNFQDSAVYLGGKHGSYCLPSFVAGYSYSNELSNCQMATNMSLCEKFCTDFFDPSSNNPTSWFWIFPGGSPSSSTDQNPTNICYNNSGTYDVTLISTNAIGSDTLIFQNYITVYATPPIPTITQVGYTLTSSPANSYQWQLNAANIPGATNQSYTVLQTGLYTVIVSDQNGCVNSADTYVLISGVDDVDDGNISIYPNPATDDLMVEWLNGLVGDEIKLSIKNALGQEIFSSREEISSRGWKKKIDMQNASAGIYFIEINTQNISLKKKIIITN